MLARDPEGYRRLCRTISAAQLAGEEKGRPVYDLDEVVADTAGHWLVLTGCRKGAVRQALAAGRPPAAAAALARPGRAVRAGQRRGRAHPRSAAHGHRAQRRPGRARRRRRAAHGRHHRRPLRHPRRPAGHGAGRGPGPAQPGRGRRLAAARGYGAPALGAEMAARFARYPGAVARAAALGAECAFAIDLVAPELPPFATPAGPHRGEWLRELTRRGVPERYGSYAEHPEAVARSSTSWRSSRNGTSPATS